MPPTLARSITVKRDAGHGHVELLVDGQPLPWFIGPDVNVQISRNDPSRVTIDLLAERVEVADAMLETAVERELPAP